MLVLYIFCYMSIRKHLGKYYIAIAIHFFFRCCCFFLAGLVRVLRFLHKSYYSKYVFHNHIQCAPQRVTERCHADVKYFVEITISTGWNWFRKRK